MNPVSNFDKHILRFFRTALNNSLHSFWTRRIPISGEITLIRQAALFCRTLVFQRSQARKRRSALASGTAVPAVLIASVTRRCNLNCAGCYSKKLRGTESEELSDEAFLSLFREAADLGVGIILIAGGEPLLRKKLIFETARIPGIIVPVFTNGTLIDTSFIDFFSSGRVIPIFSIEGDFESTARRRGSGIHEGIIDKTEILKTRGALFGLSVTLTSRNCDYVLSPEFLTSVEAAGAAVLFLIEYVPIEPDTEDMVLTDPQKQKLLSLSGKTDYRFAVVSLPGDEEQFGGCLAAGRGFIHLADNGVLEACPFAPFSDSNAAEVGLCKALNSPLMRAIRERHSELTETKGGCALWNKKGWVSTLNHL